MNPHRQIKIIDLLPGDYGSDIVCTIRSSSIDSGEPYEALSYVWGHEMAPNQINVSGDPTPVTQNLYAALQNLRSQTEKRAMWIDQLCIKQKDTHEKTHQVNMMRTIYKRCTRCIIWLGEIPEHEKGVTISDAEGVVDYLKFWAEINMEPRPALPNSLHKKEQRDAVSRAFDAMFRCGNPWWSRIWTVQEAVLPPKTLIRWGLVVLDWDIIQTGAMNMCRVDSDVWSSGDVELGHSNLQEDFIVPVRGLHIATSGENPLDLLQRWRYRAATDPRDKIYGLMGLFPSMPLPSIQSCDYSVDVRTLYKNVTIDLIEFEQGLRPLVGAPRTRSKSDLPSWTIDFSDVPGVSATDYFWDHSHRYKCFNSNGKKPLDHQVSGDRSILSLKGLLVDRVAQVGNVLELAIAADASRSDILRIVESWRGTLFDRMGADLSEPDQPYGESLAEAFWMTLVGGYLTKEFPIRRATPRDWVQILHILAEDSNIETPFAVSLQSMTVNKAFFITELGYIGIGPPNIAKDDQVWVLYGGRVPFILRPLKHDIQSDDSVECTFVGNAYVHGMMYGEALGLQRPERSVHIY